MDMFEQVNKAKEFYLEVIFNSHESKSKSFLTA